MIRIRICPIVYKLDRKYGKRNFILAYPPRIHLRMHILFVPSSVQYLCPVLHKNSNITSLCRTSFNNRIRKKKSEVSVFKRVITKYQILTFFFLYPLCDVRSKIIDRFHPSFNMKYPRCQSSLHIELT